MSRVCELTGKGRQVGNNVSHANNKTKRRFLPNLQYRRFWVESENRWVRLRVTNAALRLIDKKSMLAEAEAHMRDLKIGIRSMKQAVGTLSGGQRQGVAVARALVCNA